MTSILIIFALVVAVLLVLIIMVQNPKGGGLSSTFGGGSSMNIGGVQSTNTFLDKSTWTLAAVMIGLVIFTNLTHPNRKQNNTTKTSIENTLDDATLPANDLDAPAQGTEETPVE